MLKDIVTVILVWKHNPYEVDILCRGASYKRLVMDGTRKMDTHIMNFDDVMHTGNKLKRT